MINQYTGYVAAIQCNLCRGKLYTQDVEELAADVFLSIWNHAGQLDPDRPLKVQTRGERNPDGKVVTTAYFSRILNLSEVKSILVDGEEFPLPA